MALRLEIISDHRRELAERSRIVFGVTGGSIGRALDNDWVLPDPQRYLSGHHARVLFRQGAWYIEDTSTNGVYVNDATTPVGRRGPHALRNGDVLRMGEYRLQVNIETGEALPPPGTGTLSQIAVEHVTPVRAMGAGTDDLGASLNIEALIPESGPRGGRIGAAVPEAPMSARQRLTRLRAAARARLEGGPAALADVRNGLQAFCRGAGIDPARMPVEHEARALHLAGQLLREALLGLKEVLRAQKVFRDRYGIETDDADTLSPLNRAADEYLLQLLRGHEKHELDAVIQLRSNFSDASAQTSAVDPALRTALAQFLAHLAPANVEARARDRTGEVSPAVVWERYRDVYMTLLHATGQELPHLFTEALAQAFRHEIDNQSIDTFKPLRD
ncbi:MAG: FHA domain-containing protein [Steroidobacteraceae bacterium]